MTVGFAGKLGRAQLANGSRVRAGMRSLLALLVALLGCSPMPLPSGDGGVVDLDAGTSLDAGGLADAGVDCTAGAAASSDVVLTARGPVRGQASSGGRAFRGIPYVKPPTGALRWRAPVEESACFPATFDATQFGAQCPQLEQGQGQPFDAGGPIIGSEDCLTLNVFTPSGATPDAGLPVMFFIHGGGNTGGSASELIGAGQVRLYDGTTLAQRGNVVVVTAQYRLGVLGFLSMAELDEPGGNVSGNFGLLDQQAALRWVRRNIAAFGGDPARVMLFGESAGAIDTCTHLAMPGSAGLFHRALMQSGSCVSALPTAARRMEAATWFPGTGCVGQAEVAACLRALTPEQLIRAYPVQVMVGARRGVVSWGPTVDGVVLPQVPAEAMRAGNHHKVPLIVGSNTEETSLVTPPITTEAEYRAAVVQLVGPVVADQVLQRYPVATYGSPRRALTQVTTDAFFTCQARIATRAAAHGQPGVPVRRYVYARALQPTRGAFHGIELAYVFQKFGELSVMPMADLAVEASMLRLWTTFAATGNPNGAGTIDWPLLSSQEQSLIIDPVLSTQAGYRGAECDFFDSLGGLSIPPPP